MGSREEFRTQLRDLAENNPEHVVHIIETMGDRMETLRLLADSSMDIGTVLAWPVNYPLEVRKVAYAFASRAQEELDALLTEALEEAGDEDE